MQEKFPEPIRNLFRNAHGNADADRLEHSAPETISSRWIGFLTCTTQRRAKCSGYFQTKLPCRFTADRAVWDTRFVKSTSVAFRKQCRTTGLSYPTANWCALHSVLPMGRNTLAQ